MKRSEIISRLRCRHSLRETGKRLEFTHKEVASAISHLDPEPAGLSVIREGIALKRGHVTNDYTRGTLNGLLLAESAITGDSYEPVGCSGITTSPPKRRVHEPAGAKWCTSRIHEHINSLVVDGVEVGAVVSHLLYGGKAKWRIPSTGYRDSLTTENAKLAVAKAKADLGEDGYYWEEVYE